MLVATGCSKISPQLGFGLLKSSNDSLTIESNFETINSTSANSTVQMKGLCEANTNLIITGPSNITFKCENLSYMKEMAANLFSEGENIVSIEAFDNSQNEISKKTLKIVKDTILPTVTISGPASVTETAAEIPLNGSCSENDSFIFIQDLSSRTSASVLCVDGRWSYSAPVPPGSLVSILSYQAQHSDAAGNRTTTNSISVTRSMAPVFSITGVRNFSTERTSNLLRRNKGFLKVSWSVTRAASSYDIYIERNYQDPLVSPNIACSQAGATGNEAVLNLDTGCALNLGENLRIKVLGWNEAHSGSTTEYYEFSVKAAPSFRSDANLIYINSDSEIAIDTVKVSFAELINDPEAVGPFTVTVTDPGFLSEMVTPDNVSTTRSLNISPTTAVSGIFPIKIKIADENSITSEEITLKIAIVYPYSWSGLVSTDFSVKGNWCGVAVLKSGCSGVSTLPSSTTRIFMDNLCDQPKPSSPNANCISRLSSDSTVRSMLIKYGTFMQDGYNFSVGIVSDSGSYFKMSAGAFNDGSVGGTLNIFKSFLVEGGVFNAPKYSDINMNTNMASNGSEDFKVLDAVTYNHNNSTLKLMDPSGGSRTQVISVPNDFTLNDLVINSNGGNWGIKSTNLILVGDLTLSGTMDSGSNYPSIIAATGGGKISLSGNLNCTGAFGGGNLPVYMLGSSAKYKSTYPGCKLPQIKVADASVNVNESTSSSENTTLNSLSVTAGSFTAPISTRKLIFKSSGLDDNTLVADLNNGGFFHNNGTVVFETASDGQNYRIKLPDMNDLIFTNPENLSSFYDIQNNFIGNSFSLKGSYTVPVRGSGRIATFSQLNFDTGFVTDLKQLTRLVLQSSGASSVNVNTSNKINIPQLELINVSEFSGGSSTINFSGTSIILNTNDIYIHSNQSLIYYYSTSDNSFSVIGEGDIEREI